MRSEASKKKSMGKKWFSHVLKTAKSSYKKSKRGGGDDDKVAFPPMQVRKGGKTRRHSRR
jgi:hypothetical protein